MCQKEVILLSDFAYTDRFGWAFPPSVSRSEAFAAPTSDKYHLHVLANDTDYTHRQGKQLPAFLIQQLGPGYNGTFPVRYINSMWLCEQPSSTCSKPPSSGGYSDCLLQEYTNLLQVPSVGSIAENVEPEPGAGGGLSVRVLVAATCVGELW